LALIQSTQKDWFAKQSCCSIVDEKMLVLSMFPVSVTSNAVGFGDLATNPRAAGLGR
jgi:hypothetical protein